MEREHAALAVLKIDNRVKVSLLRRGKLPPPSPEGDALLSLMKEGERLLFLGREGYPPLLEEISDPPLFLHARGRVSHRPCVTFAGNTDASREALLLSRLFGRRMAAMGYALVVGGGGACDRAALEGCLNEGGEGIVVLASGMDYRDATLRASLFVSPYLPHSEGGRRRSQERSAVMTALSRVTVIAEASSRSSALTVAREALDGGREVALLPTALGRGWRKEGGCLLYREGCPVVRGCAKDSLFVVP